MTLLDNVSSTSIFPSGEIHPKRCLDAGRDENENE